MSKGEAAIELHYLLWMIGIVLAGNTLVGATQAILERMVVAIIQATAFTAVAFLATIRPNEIDGQTGLGIPLMWVPFFVVSWLGVTIGNKLRRD